VPFSKSACTVAAQGEIVCISYQFKKFVIFQLDN
jgi:hypothetical protein